MSDLTSVQSGSTLPQEKCSKVLSCSQCSRRFSRPSHLDRHIQTHLPTARRPAVACRFCDRVFSRKDVLLRHQRSAHQTGHYSQRSVQKSCFRCVQKKLKCDRAQPCRSCSLANASCLYRHNREQEEVYSQIMSTSTTLPGQLSGSSPEDATESEHSSFWASGVGDEQLSNTSPEFSSLAPYDLSSHDGNLDPSLSNLQEYGSLVPEDENYFPTDGPAFEPSLPIPNDQLNFQAGAFDWLEFQVPDLALPNAAFFASPPQHTPSLSNHATLQTVENSKAVNPWPFDQTQDLQPHQHQLPPLRFVLPTTLRSNINERNGISEGVLHLLSEPWLPSQDVLEQANLSPALHSLQKLVDIYFRKFHPIQPIMHVPSWSMASCPTVLLAAMACVGAMLSDEPNAATLSDSLSDLCIPMTTWLGASDSANFRDISYLNSLCLHQIYSLGSGSRQLYQNADRSRGVLIGSLRGMGLLTSRLGVVSESDDPTFSATSDNSAVHNEWVAWVAREREKRTTWAAFEYDCSLCTLTSRRGAVDLSELPQRLPCADSLWEAPSSSAWMALRSILGPNAMGAKYSSVLTSAQAGKPIPESVSFWGKRLCAQMVGRLLWDLKQMEIISLRNCFGLPSLHTVQQRPKSSLLLRLDNLLASMNRSSSTIELISYNIASLLCHYSHLFSTKDVMDFTLFIVRHVVSQSSNSTEAVKAAERRLRAAFANDEQQARKLVWHAAQIVAVAKEYLVSAPCEILRLFMGYIFIIAFARYFPKPAASPGLPASHFRVDLHQKMEKRDIAEWIECGGPASIGSAHDIHSAGAALAISQDAQSLLQHLRCWGLADKFIKILQAFAAHPD